MTRPFSNPITGENGTLIRARIMSPNFVTGVSGWTINKDGSAEFNNAVFRGDVVVGGVTPPNLTMSSTIPPELVTFYATNWAGTIGDFVIKMSVDANNYTYELLLTASSVGVALAEGFVIAGVVRERVLSFVSGGQVFTDYGDFSTSNVRMFGANLLGDDTTPGSDMSFGSFSLPRGVRLATQLSGNPILTATGGGAEVLIFHTGSFTYAANRAYHFVVWITEQASVAAGTATYRWRVGNGITGAIRVTRLWPVYSTGRREVRLDAILITGGSPVTQDMSLTIQAQAGSNISVYASGGAQGQWQINDVGGANTYLSYPSL